MNRAVFMDRDGVINRAVVKEGRPYPPRSVAEIDIVPGILTALQRLKIAGYLIIVITNQPDVARRIQTRGKVEEIHDYLFKSLPIDAIYTCYHDDADRCLCRKPLPGLILQAGREFHIQLEASFMVGDRWKDIEAGSRAGCTTILIANDYHEKRPESQNHTVRSLSEAADVILESEAAE